MSEGDDGRPLRDGRDLRPRAQHCVGFFADPDAHRGDLRPDGWVRSGDLATLDADGYLTVVGRKKEIIIRGGMNITPREIEDLIARLRRGANASR